MKYVAGTMYGLAAALMHLDLVEGWLVFVLVAFGTVSTLLAVQTIVREALKPFTDELREVFEHPVNVRLINPAQRRRWAPFTGRD